MSSSLYTCVFYKSNTEFQPFFQLTFVDQVKAGDDDARTNGDAKIPGILYLDPNAKKKQETPLVTTFSSSSAEPPKAAKRESEISFCHCVFFDGNAPIFKPKKGGKFKLELRTFETSQRVFFVFL